jgi:hypothetical protein
MAPPMMVSPVCGRHWRPGDRQPPESFVVPASSDWPDGRAVVEPAAPKSFTEPATPGWLAASFSPEAAAPGSGGGTWAGAGSPGT